MTLRWSEDDLKAFRARQAQWDAIGTVRTHRVLDDEELKCDPRQRTAEEKAAAKEEAKRRRKALAEERRAARAKQAKRPESELEKKLAAELRAGGYPEPQRDFLFLPDRKLELDFAWPDRKVAIEVQGMAHRIKGRFKADIEKRALAMLSGWKVLEVDGASIRCGRAARWVKQLLEAP